MGMKNSSIEFLSILLKILRVSHELKQKDPNFKGNIDIEIVSNNDYIIIEVNDNGSGITDAKKAMTPYFTTKKLEQA